ncbi:RNA-directed DNA polymerase, eukaryota, reverse transcriptase zinc-binding domain protein [Tanacetum coccineum]
MDMNYSIANRVPLQDLSSVFRRQPRRGVEMAQLSELQSKIGNVVLSDQGDTWHWALDSLGYSVALARSLIDSKTLDTALNATHSACSIPIKFNIFIWRLMLNKLPSRINLDRKCIDVGSTFFPICQADVETINHVFFSCVMALDMWAMLARWWELDIPVCANIMEWFEWLGSLHVSYKAKSILEGVGATLIWSIWSFRNRLIFSNPPPKKAVLLDSIVSQSYFWISTRNPKFSINWVDWLCKHIDSIVLL